MIYLIACNQNNTCKIGYTNNVEKRLASLQTANAFLLTLDFIMEGDISKERELHELFNKHRLMREWFHYHDEIKEYFIQHGTMIEQQIKIYYSLLEKLHTLHETALHIYFYLLANVSTTSRFYLSTKEKENIKTHLNMKCKNNEVINRALRELTQEKFLIKCDDRDSTFKINPRYAFKGSTMERNAALKAVIELECPDC